MKARAEELEKNRATLSDQLSAAKQSNALQVKEASRLNTELTQTAEKYNSLLAQSKNVTELVKESDRLYAENDKLQAANDTLNTEAQRLRQDVVRLRRTEMLWLFLAGAGVFFVGLTVGKVSKKKKRY